jgi:hypothetical protein
LIKLFEKLSSVMDDVRKDIENASDDDDNPLLWSLQQKFGKSLCAIWDVWEHLSVEPGDLGVFQGEDTKRPIFQKFTNVASRITPTIINHPNSERIVIKPDSSLWSTDSLADGTIR